MSGIQTYTVTCVAPTKGMRDLVADLLDLARDSISPFRLAWTKFAGRESDAEKSAHDPRSGSGRPFPPYVPIASDAFQSVSSTPAGRTATMQPTGGRQEGNAPIAEVAGIGAAVRTCAGKRPVRGGGRSPTPADPRPPAARLLRRLNLRGSLHHVGSTAVGPGQIFHASCQAPLEAHGLAACTVG